jgi:hypothetical protein
MHIFYTFIRLQSIPFLISMKKLLLFLFLYVSSISLHAQTKTKPNVVDNVKEIQGSNFRLFPTTNMWTFIKLDTRNGLMWQIQYSLNSEGRMVTSLNLDPLISLDKEVKDRFTLYPTQNMYNFILLDQISGKTWQVQWSIDYINRHITPIE